MNEKNTHTHTQNKEMERWFCGLQLLLLTEDKGSVLRAYNWANNSLQQFQGTQCLLLASRTLDTHDRQVKHACT